MRLIPFYFSQVVNFFQPPPAEFLYLILFLSGDSFCGSYYQRVQYHPSARFLTMTSDRAAPVIALCNDVLLYTRVGVITWVYASKYLPTGRNPPNLRRRLISDLFWLPSILGPGFYLSTLIQDDPSLWYQQLIFVSLQWLYLEAFTASRVRLFLF